MDERESRTGPRRTSLREEIRFLLQLRRIVGNREFVRVVADHYRTPSGFAWYRELKPHLTGRSCLEIGGPSAIFQDRSAVPIYSCLGSWDNIDFARRTLWSGSPNGAPDRAWNGTSTGRQFIADATRLESIPSGSYDVVLSSHVIEHLANPIRALREWRRILKPDGVLVALVPEGARTFDHARATTEPAHFQEDLSRDVSEDDLGHVPEIVQSHDVAMDPGLKDRAELIARSQRNGEVRALHHHVFTPDSLRALVDSSGFSTTLLARVAPIHILVSARVSS